MASPFDDPFGSDFSLEAATSANAVDSAGATESSVENFFLAPEDGADDDDDLLMMGPTTEADEAVSTISAAYRGLVQRRKFADMKLGSVDKSGSEDEEESNGSIAVLPVGTVVDCRYGGLDDWYRGKIERVNEPTDSEDSDKKVTYDVLYDDGDRETGQNLNLPWTFFATVCLILFMPPSLA